MEIIINPQQLVETIGLLSGSVTEKNYWINVALPRAFKWIIAWQWEDAVINILGDSN